MKEIYDYLSGINNLQLNIIENERGGIDNIYANQEDKVYYSITGPHSGNGHTYLVRADAAATHDRWSNCDWEYNFDTKEQIISFFNLGGLDKIALYVLYSESYIADMASYLGDSITNRFTFYWTGEETHETGNN